MAKYGLLLAFLFVGGLAHPAPEDASNFDEDMSIFFDHTETDIEGRIVGGTTAAEGAFPWMVAMTNGVRRSFLCGGSVLTNRHVLSAAHCIAAAISGGQVSSTLRVTVGTNRWNSGGQTYNIQAARNHPQYDSRNIKNDIGILITSSAIVWNTRVRAIPVATNFIGANVACRVSGWGRTVAGGAIATNLQQINLNTIVGSRCVSEVARMGQVHNMRLPAVNPNIELCTFVSVNRGTCNGDSGSALVLNSNNQQIGIVSWGLPCARGAPDMFVRVSAYISWIRSITG